MKHIIINLIIAWIAVFLWVGNRKLAKKIRNEKPGYADYLYKLHLILNKSEYEIFKIAADQANNYSYDEHFKQYLIDGSFPSYLEKFLEEGKSYIEDYKIKTWTH
jgi:predicted AAA+ superfamily ATPase